MNAKLTLKMDESIIQSAKRYAKSRHTSVSKLTESYLRSITSDREQAPKRIAGIVGELAGILRNVDISTRKDDHIEYLEEKYK